MRCVDVLHVGLVWLVPPFFSEEWFLVFGLLCHHTASNSITSETHTSGNFFVLFIKSTQLACLVHQERTQMEVQFFLFFLWFGRPKPITQSNTRNKMDFTRGNFLSPNLQA